MLHNKNAILFFFHSVVARQCMEPSQVQGVDIPTGMIVQANVWQIHYDPKIWGKNPEQFKQER